jgi:hypothetical protein
MEDIVVEGWYYTYKGKRYKVSKYQPGVLLVKDATSGNWSDAVEYTQSDAADRTHLFVRARDDFAKKFKLDTNQQDADQVAAEAQDGEDPCGE